MVSGLKTQVALKEDLIDLVRKEVLEKLSQSKLPEAVKVLWVGLDLHIFHEKSGDIHFIEVPVLPCHYVPLRFCSGFCIIVSACFRLLNFYRSFDTGMAIGTM